MAQFCRKLALVYTEDNISHSLREKTYTADNLGTSAAFAHHVASTAGSLVRVGTLTSCVHVGHIFRMDAGNAIPKGLLGVNGHDFVGASQGRSNQGAPVLDQAMVDQATCAGERIESCEVNVGDDANRNAKV